MFVGNESFIESKWCVPSYRLGWQSFLLQLEVVGWFELVRLTSPSSHFLISNEGSETTVHLTLTKSDTLRHQIGLGAEISKAKVYCTWTNQSCTDVWWRMRIIIG
jgi:hypothetical protein